MKREIKEAWLKRLESPEAKHARGKLHNPRTGGMCCLGHLMHMAGIPPEDFAVNSHRHNGDFPDRLFLKNVGLAPMYAKRLAEANDRNKRFPLAAIRALPVED